MRLGEAIADRFELERLVGHGGMGSGHGLARPANADCRETERFDAFVQTWLGEYP